MLPLRRSVSWMLMALAPAACQAPSAGPPAASDRAPRAVTTYHPGKVDSEVQRRGNPGYALTLEPAARPVRGATAGWDRERVWSSGVDWEPVVAAHPSSSRVYQAAIRYYSSPCEGCPDPIVVVRRSDDGGATWRPDAYPFRGGRSQADAQLAVADDGTVFLAFMQDFRPGVLLARSEDGGENWSEPLPVTGATAPRWSDHPLLLISADGAHVYVALNASDSYLVASHDGGRTFARAVRTSDDRRYWFHTGGTVTTEGHVYVAAVDYRRNFRGATHVNVLRSLDGGLTWSSTRVDSSAESPPCDWGEGCYQGYLGPRASLAVDGAGILMLVYNAGVRAGAPQALWYRTSRDGRVWSPRRRVVVSPPGTGHAFPLVVSGNAPGDFRVAWQDDRRRPTFLWNTYYRRTSDAGESWEPRVRLSGDGQQTGYKSPRGYAFPYGDYFGLSVDSQGRNHVIWGAGESYWGNGGVWYTRGR